jgi:hypothetical protein
MPMVSSHGNEKGLSLNLGNLVAMKFQKSEVPLCLALWLTTVCVKQIATGGIVWLYHTPSVQV